jgi:hypothetical protein
MKWRVASSFLYYRLGDVLKYVLLRILTQFLGS